MAFILGKKIGMSQIFDEKGDRIPATLVEAGPCQILQVKTKEKDGYESFQMGFVKKTRKIKKTEKGKEFEIIREFIVNEDKSSSPSSPIKVGSIIDVSIFKEGDKVKISGVSKGKGFQGAVKRWGFSGRNATHGVKHEHRTLGSVGTSFPERVIKGRKMPGRTGGDRTTVKNLKIIKVDKENNLLAIRGALPGAKGTLLEIRR
jgi:large subunit ribosomal protein L3